MSLIHQVVSTAPVARAPKKSKSEKPVNVMTTTADITDVATVDQQIEQHAQNVERIQRNAFFEIGKELWQAKEAFKYSRNEGGFSGWLSRRLPHIAVRSADKMIELASSVDEEMLANLANFSFAAQLEYAKAEPDTQAIIAERVAAGEVFTAAQVKELKAAAAQEAIDRINSEAEQAKAELAALKKTAEDKDIKSAAEVRDRDQRIEELTAKLKGYEEQVEKFQKSLPKPAKAKEQAAEAGGVVLGSDGKFHSGSSAEQKRMHDAFMFAFDKALDLTENPPSPERVVAGCPEGDRVRLAELCMAAADYFIKIRASLNDK